LTRQSKRIATENKWLARTARVVDLKVEADGDLTLHSSYLSLTTAPTAPFVIEQPLLAPQPAAVTAARITMQIIFVAMARQTANTVGRF
jgi:hypothetical protein